MAFFFLAYGAPVACAPTPTPHPAVHLIIGGASAVQPVITQLAAQYQALYPFATIDLRQGNSSTGLHALGQGLIDIALLSRDPRADELSNSRWHAVELGRDAVVVLVHPKNKLTSLTRDELAKVYSGEIQDWSQLNVAPTGQTPSPIQVISREEGSGTRAVFEQIIMAGRRVTLTALVQSGEQDVIDYVSSHPSSIGYAAAAVWKNRLSAHALAIDNIQPSLATIQAETYPLMRSFYLVVPDSARSEVEDFVGFAVSPEGQKIVQAASALPR